jgi:hypothetical protein
MSKTSHVPVRFVGGPMGGTTKDYLGEPKKAWAPKEGGLGGSYAFEWDRDGDGAKLRSGVYTWDHNADAAPADGDAASALMEELGPEKAAERLNDSGSSAIISSGEGTDDRKSQETGDNASAKVALAEEKAAGKSEKAAQDSADGRVEQAQLKDSKTSSAYDRDESGANTKRPTSSASKGSSTSPSSKPASK